MQIMPETWVELRVRYDLGIDPFDPHDNILAGLTTMRLHSFLAGRVCFCSICARYHRDDRNRILSQDLGRFRALDRIARRAGVKQPSKAG